MPSETTETLFYECPHCHEKIEINEAVLDEKVECLKCGHPFVPETPSAKPLLNEPTTGTAERSKDGLADTTEEALPPEERDDIVNPAQDEDVIHKIHPTVFRRHIFMALLSGLLLIGGIVLAVLGLGGTAWLGLPAMAIAIAGGVIAVAALIALGRWWAISRFTTLTLTTERIIYRFGVFNRRTSEVRHVDVRNMKIDQNFLERMLHFGDMAISSAGQDDMEIKVYDVPDPEKVADFVRQHQQQ